MVVTRATVYTVQTKQSATPTSNRHAHEYISVRAPFTANSITGRAQPAIIRFGELPAQFHDAIHDAMLRDDTYVVFSYDTPIAWFTAGLWFMPDVKYSNTTSKHQNIVKRAIKEGDNEH